MKVLVAGHTYVVSANRERWRKLCAMGVDVTVCAPEIWGDGVRAKSECDTENSDTGLSVKTLPTTGSKGDGLRFRYAWTAWRRVLKSFRPDIVHIEQEPFSAALALAQWNVFKKIPVTAFTWENINKPWGLPFMFYLNRTLKNIRAFQCGNEEAANVLRQQGYKGMIDIFPQLGVSLADYKERIPRGENEGLRVGYIGRLVPQKGVADIINAIKNVEGATLSIIGRGNIEENLRKLACDIGVNNRVNFIGAVPHKEVASEFSKIDVLVLPSHSTKGWVEQFGHVLIEAMAAGVLVIGSDSGAIPRVIDSAGWVFPEGNVKALTNLLIACKNGDIPPANGKERVKKYFTHDVLASRTKQFLENVIGS